MIDARSSFQPECVIGRCPMIKTKPHASFHIRTGNGEWECHLPRAGDTRYSKSKKFNGGYFKLFMTEGFGWFDRQVGRETVSTIIELDLDVAAIWLPVCRRSTKGTPSGFRSSRLKFADWRYVCSSWASQLLLGRRASVSLSCSKALAHAAGWVVNIHTYCLN